MVTFARSGRTDVRVRVVAVDSPGGENPFGEAIFAGATDVIHDFVATIFYDGFTDSRGEIIQNLVPTDALPFSFAAFSTPLERIQNSIRIVDLIERRRALCAITSARSRVLRIPFELLNLIGVLIDVGKQTARRLAIETSRRHQLIVPLLTPRPCLGIQLSPIIPALPGRKRREMNARRAGIGGLVGQWSFFSSAIRDVALLSWFLRSPQ